MFGVSLDKQNESPTRDNYSKTKFEWEQKPRIGGGRKQPQFLCSENRGALETVKNPQGPQFPPKSLCSVLSISSDSNELLPLVLKNNSLPLGPVELCLSEP